MIGFYTVLIQLKVGKKCITRSVPRYVFYTSLSVKIHESYTSVKKSEDSCKNTRVFRFFYTGVRLMYFYTKTSVKKLESFYLSRNSLGDRF